MWNLSGRVALVTGGSSGIGLAITRALARSGARVVCVSRRAGSIEAHECVVPISADLTDDSSVSQILDAVGDRLDILVHSAGTITLGRIQDLDVATLDEQYRLNVRAPFVITRALLPQLLAARGQIVFINSSAGLAARAGTSQYAASKHALKAFADSLRDEVHDAGVRVLSVYPGRTATAMQERTSMMEGGRYDAAACLRAEDIADTVMSALALPTSAEVKDISIRPMKG